jgi:hypothetical protein
MLLKILTLYILILDNQLHVVATSPEENKCQHTKYRNVGRVLGLSACARGEKKKKREKKKNLCLCWESNPSHFTG